MPLDPCIGTPLVALSFSIWRSVSTFTGRVGTGDSEEMTLGGDRDSTCRRSMAFLSPRIWKGEAREGVEEDEGLGEEPGMEAGLGFGTDFGGPSRVRTGGASSTGVGGLAPNVLGACPFDNGCDGAWVDGCEGAWDASVIRVTRDLALLSFRALVGWISGGVGRLPGAVGGL